MGNTRTFALLGQSGAGKTALTQAMLELAGEKFKRPPEGPTHALRVHHLTWQKVPYFFIDTPGDDNFLGETRLAAWAADFAVLVVDATSPVKVQLEKAYAAAREEGLPLLVFVNKLDQEKARLEDTLHHLRERLELNPVPVAYPLGEEAQLRGIIDLLKLKVYIPEGRKVRVENLPEDLRPRAEELRQNMVEFAAEGEDELLEKYLEEGELSPEEILRGLKRGILSGKVAPVVVGSVIHLIGVARLLDAVAEFGPSPAERGSWLAEGDGSTEVSPSPEGPAVLTVFKTLVDPYAGRLSLARIISGKLSREGELYNPSREATERYAHLSLAQGDELQEVEEAGPGALVVLPKLSETRTGDTLVSPGLNLRIPPPELPHPVLTYALHPESRADEDKIGPALAKLLEEDPTLRVTRDEETRELLLSGLGQIHLEKSVEKLRERYGVRARMSLPKIPYRETIKKAAQGVIYRHKKQTGGRGQFAEVHFHVFPLPRGEGFEFVETLTGMNVPRNFVPAVEKGVREAMEKGPLAGYPVVDVKVQFYDGKSHEVDSSDMAFKIAAFHCFKKAMEQCQPVLLEPVMELEIEVPEENMGDVIGDLNARRGRVLGMEPRGKMQLIKAQVPLAEIQRYALDLNSLTGGRGTFRMRFSHYEEVPAPLAQKVIEAAREEKAAA
ncbi:MAG: elongation factor G [Thermodesulfatator sp.]|nr:MAG: elongation factor G [Thermodesulfatator sp.]